MKIISTNIAKPQTIEWRGETQTTGMYKKPTKDSLFLGKEDVAKDSVINRKYHGGIDKACYVYGENHYAFWKEKYPDLDWSYGMFGENLSLDSVDETQIRIGNTYKVGQAIVQVSQPREPCYKLGLRFENQRVVKEFYHSRFSGFYIRVIQEGEVNVGDSFELIQENVNGLTVEDVYGLLSYNKGNASLREKAKEEVLLAENYRSAL